MTKRELIQALEDLDLPDDTKIVNYNGPPSECWRNASGLEIHYVKKDTNQFWCSKSSPSDEMTDARIEII